MTCRHKAGDPNCSSNKAYINAATQLQKRIAELEQRVDASNYDIEAFERVGPHVVLRVRYPSCKDCSFEGVKIMVFLNVTEIEMMRWRKIDPHFRDEAGRNPREAPSPAARFPATEDGMRDAIDFCNQRIIRARLDETQNPPIKKTIVNQPSEQ